MNAAAHFERMQRRFEEAAEHEHGRRAARRTRRRLAITATAVVAAAAIALVAVNLANPSAEASTVRVERNGDQLTVRLVGLVTDAQRMADDLAEAGVPADVHAVTTGPSRAGTILSVYLLGVSQDFLIASDPRSYTFVVAPGVRAEIDLGTRPAKGAPYDQPVDATAPGEPLHCRVAVGDTVAAARPHTALDGVAVTWSLEQAGTPSQALDAAALDEAAAAQLYVQTARRTADDRIEISVAAAARVPVAAPDCR